MKKVIAICLIALAAIAVLTIANCTDNAVSSVKDEQANDFARRFNARPDTGGGGTTTRTLTVSIVPSAGGSVTVNGTAYTVPRTLNNGTSVTVAATPADDGYAFNGWTGTPSGVNASNASITFNINANLTLTANFYQSVTPPSGDTVRIGNRTWMGRNLNIETANSWCYDNSPDSCAKYGRLYTWDAARTACSAAAGWRLPNRQEWQGLFAAVGGTSVAGRVLKAKLPDWDGDDTIGFSALPGGYRHPVGNFGFLELDDNGYWWSATEYNSSNAWHVFMYIGRTSVHEDWLGKSLGFSVRCVRN